MPVVEFFLILSVLSQVLLTFFVLLLMRAVRMKAYKDGAVKVSDIALNPHAWPDNVRKVQNSYANQFELPVLFYCVVLLALNVGGVDWGFTALAWVFALSRWAHMYIHIRTNFIPYRFIAFVIGVSALMALWLYLLVKLALIV